MARVTLAMEDILQSDVTRVPPGEIEPRALSHGARAKHKKSAKLLALREAHPVLIPRLQRKAVFAIESWLARTWSDTE